MVSLVADDETEVIRPEAVKPAYQALHTGGDDLLPVAAAGCSLNAVGAVEVFSWLLHQLLPVGEDQHPLPVTRDVCKSHRLPKPGGHLGQICPGRLGLNGLDALSLVWS